MRRFVGVSLGVLVAAMIGWGLLSLDHPHSYPAQVSLATRRPRVFPAHMQSVPVGGFSGNLQPFRPPEDRRENIRHLLLKGQVLAAQTAISEWYTADPAAAVDWLEMQPSWAEYQPAISQIAKEMAEAGYPLDALKWAELLEEGENREEIIFEIYATGRRYNWLTDDQIRAAPFSSRKIDALLSGAADD